MSDLKADFARFTEMLGVWGRAAEHEDGLPELRRRMEQCKERGDLEGANMWAFGFVTCCLKHGRDLEGAEQVAKIIVAERPYRSLLLELGLVLALRGKMGEAWRTLQRACTVAEDPMYAAAEEFIQEFERSLNK